MRPQRTKDFRASFCLVLRISGVHVHAGLDDRSRDDRDAKALAWRGALDGTGHCNSDVVGRGGPGNAERLGWTLRSCQVHDVRFDGERWNLLRTPPHCPPLYAPPVHLLCTGSRPRVDTTRTDLREGFALEERVRQICLGLPEDSFLRGYIAYASGLTDCNMAYHVGGALALLSQTIPDSLHIRLGSRLYGNLYILIVGPSTHSRKTAAVKIAREILDEALPGKCVEAPGSYEALIDGLRTQPRQLIPYEEFGHFLSGSEHSYLTPIKTALTNIFDGSPAGRATVSGKKAGKSQPVVQNPRLSLFCACAPGYLSRHTEPVDWTDGFFARFLTLQAPRAREYDITPGDNMQYRSWIVTRLRSLAASMNTPGLFVGMDSEAQWHWKEWSRSHAKIASERSVSKTVGAIGRSQALVLKVALLLAWERQIIGTSEWQLTRRELLPAIEIVKLHLDSVLSIGENLGGTPAMNDRQAVLQVLDYEQPKTLGQIIQGAFLLKRRVLEILESLGEDGSIVKCWVEQNNIQTEAFKRARDPKPGATPLIIKEPGFNPFALKPDQSKN